MPWYIDENKKTREWAQFGDDAYAEVFDPKTHQMLPYTPSKWYFRMYCKIFRIKKYQKPKNLKSDNCHGV